MCRTTAVETGDEACVQRKSPRGARGRPAMKKEEDDSHTIMSGSPDDEMQEEKKGRGRFPRRSFSFVPVSRPPSPPSPPSTSSSGGVDGTSVSCVTPDDTSQTSSRHQQESSKRESEPPKSIAGKVSREPSPMPCLSSAVVPMACSSSSVDVTSTSCDIPGVPKLPPFIPENIPSASSGRKQAPKKRAAYPKKTAGDGGREPNENDVLYLKGAAAQTTSNPGNLLFYRLCERHYDEFAAVAVDHPRRREITEEIVDFITSQGGVFRKAGGGAMKYSDAITKTRDRLRQNGKPKVRPQGFGDDDVVYARGAAIHLYPGNTKWRELMEGYVRSYFRDVLNGTAPSTMHQRGRKGHFAKGNDAMTVRPSYQIEIVEEMIRIIVGRGGKFLDEGGNQVSVKHVRTKAHQSFKDLKKDLIAGRKAFVPHPATGPHSAMKKEEGGYNPFVDGGGASTNAGDKCAKIFRTRKGGFTAVKAVVTNARELKSWQKKNKKSEETGKYHGNTKRDYSHKDYPDDDECSFQSEMLCSESDDDGSDEDGGPSSGKGKDGNYEEVISKRANKQQQDNAREARAAARDKRMLSGVVEAPPPLKKPRKKKKKVEAKKEEEEEVPSSPDHPLSEYELYRLEKIKRNRAKLAELGLLNNNGRKGR